MSILSSLVIAFSMYSKIPMPHVDWNEKNMRYVMCFFPLVGLVIGAVQWGVFFLCSSFDFTPSFTAALLLTVPLLLTGGIHFDGFLDTSDALGSYKSKDEKLKILSDSHVGAIAVLHACLYFLLYYGAYTQASLKEAPLLALTFILSRSLSGFSIVALKAAKPDGLASSFQNSANRNIVRRVSIVTAFFTCAAMLMYNLFSGILGILTALIVFVRYRNLSYRQFGGITGDLAGYFLQICELCLTLVFVISGRFML